MNKHVKTILLSLLLVATLSTVTVTAPVATANPVYIINGVQLSDNTAQPQDDVKRIDFHSQAYSRFTDYAAGFSLLVPSQMQPDLSNGAVRTVFQDSAAQIEVYYDNFAGTISSANDYIYYGNRQTLRSSQHSVIRDEWTEIDGYRAHILEWSRRKLARVENDKNHYFSAEIIKNENEVYTIFIKAAEPLPDAMSIVQSFQITGPQGSLRNYKDIRPSQTNLNAETAAFLKQYFSAASPLTWGIFEPSAPETMTYLTALESRLEHKFPFLIRYHGLDEQAPLRGLQKAYETNRYVELTLQTTHSDDVNALLAGSDRNAAIMYAILDGQYDDYLHEYAQRLKSFGHPVLFRLNNEMNGDWCWYSAYYSGKDTDIYKAVWKYIHTLFKRSGVDNVLWVWNPHDVSRPDFKWNHYLMYYPGDEYVDIIGLTGYNTGTYFPGEHWRPFHEIYPPLYAEYSAAFAKPFMITEFGSNSVGGSKTAWIESMFDQIGQLPNIKAAIWWSGTDHDQQGNAGRIYVLDENDRTVEVFHKRLQEYSKDVRLTPQKVSGERFSLTYPQALSSPQLAAFNQAVQLEAAAFSRQFSQPEVSGSLDYRVERNSEGIVSITLKKFSYLQHAAHPMTFWKSFTYNSRTGSLYRLQDLFKPAAAYAAELNRYIAYQISEQQLPLLQPFKGIKADQDFFLTTDSLVIYYQLYEYTPYVYGFLTFKIPLEELQPLLKEECLPSGMRKED